MVQNRSILDIYCQYEQCLSEFDSTSEHFPELKRVWFSDSFMLYAEDDGPSAYVGINYVAKWFFRHLTQIGVPINGAVSCAPFYGDHNNHIYLGPALVEAYSECNAQDWIGIILCPSAENQLNQLGLPPDERIDIRPWSVSFKAGNGAIRKVNRFAYYIDNKSFRVDGINVYYASLKQMYLSAPDTAKHKYKNTFEFIKHYADAEYDFDKL